MTSDRDEQIARVHEQQEMDFVASHAAAVFRVFGWEWHEDGKVVSHSQIRAALAEMTVQASRDQARLNADTATAESGRLAVRINEDGSADVYVSLGNFVPEIDDE